MRKILLMIVVLAVAAGSARAEFSAELNQLLSKLQAMSHGSFDPAEWQSVMSQLDGVSSRAQRNGDLEAVVQSRAIKAMVLADMRDDIPAALAVLEQAKTEYGQRKLPSVKRLYVQQAELYSRQGNSEAVRKVIEEFRANPNYDPHEYGVALGEGRNTPITLVRPTARGADSVSVTAMELARERSRFAPGNLFPSFTLTDGLGAPISLADYRGKVVLIDFWQPGWTPWQRDLEYQISLYRRYQPSGLEVIGLALGQEAAARACADQYRLPWRQIYSDTTLTRQLGIFGEATNFLIDRNGVIIGRNLRGAELAAAVNRALSVK